MSERQINCPLTAPKGRHFATYDTATRVMTCPIHGVLERSEVLAEVRDELDSFHDEYGGGLLHDGDTIRQDEKILRDLAKELFAALPGRAELVAELVASYNIAALNKRVPDEHFKAIIVDAFGNAGKAARRRTA